MSGYALQDIERAVQAHQQAMTSVTKQSSLILQVLAKMATCLRNGGKVMWCGNGGSAADAQHMAAELMVRYRLNRRPLASVALTTDTSILTAHPNDYDFASVFARQVEGLARPGDMLIGMSTSGRSENVIQAMKTGKACGCVTVALTGANQTELDEICDITLHVDSTETARIQEVHNVMNHLICEGLDVYFADSET
jgi:D-sedoheptulose 7-phosphate isomerase